MLDFTEINKLKDLLTDETIPFTFRKLYDGFQILYPDTKDRNEKTVCDVVIHSGSYGCNSGLLEIMGLVADNYGDDVEGYLTAIDCYERIKKHYQEEVVKGGK